MTPFESQLAGEDQRPTPLSSWPPSFGSTHMHSGVATNRDLEPNLYFKKDFSIISNSFSLT